MLEVDGHLRTWALSDLPKQAELPKKTNLLEEAGTEGELVAETEIDAEQLADHRIAYLDYEGEISGGRGTVTRWDRGTYTLVTETALQLVLQLRGEKMRGRVRLKRSDKTSNDWSFTFKHDA